MTFASNLMSQWQRFKQNFDRQLPNISNEKDTRRALINPFLEMLGWSFSNLADVETEYQVSWGDTYKQRIDYTLFVNGKPWMFIEAKSANLVSFSPQEIAEGQLRRYATTTEGERVQLLAATNGKDWYWYYRRVDRNSGRITLEPIYNISVFEPKEADLGFLGVISKSNADSESKEVESFLISNEIRRTLKSWSKAIIDSEPKELDSLAKLLERHRPNLRDMVINVPKGVVAGYYRREIPAFFRDSKATTDPPLQINPLPSDSPMPMVDAGENTGGSVQPTGDVPVENGTEINPLLTRRRGWRPADKDWRICETAADTLSEVLGWLIAQDIRGPQHIVEQSSQLSRESEKYRVSKPVLQDIFVNTNSNNGAKLGLIDEIASIIQTENGVPWRRDEHFVVWLPEGRKLSRS